MRHHFWTEASYRSYTSFHFVKPTREEASGSDGLVDRVLGLGAALLLFTALLISSMAYLLLMRKSRKLTLL